LDHNIKQFLPAAVHVLARALIVGVASLLLNNETLDTKHPTNMSHQEIAPGPFRTMPMEKVADFPSNAGIGDLKGDGHRRILLLKGRHEPLNG